MSPERKCPVCGGSAEQVKLSAGFGQVYLYRRGKGAAIEKSTPLHAWVCIDCGHVELAAEDPAVFSPENKYRL